MTWRLKTVMVCIFEHVCKWLQKFKDSIYVLDDVPWPRKLHSWWYCASRMSHSWKSLCTSHNLPAALNISASSVYRKLRLSTEHMLWVPKKVTCKKKNKCISKNAGPCCLLWSWKRWFYWMHSDRQEVMLLHFYSMTWGVASFLITQTQNMFAQSDRKLYCFLGY